MTLDQLRYFQAVCKFGGVSRAAEELNISQPSVSNAISNLEKEFGVELFSRQNKRLVLTDAGQQMAELTSGFLQQADHLSRTMHELGSQNKLLRLGVPPMIGSLVLPTLFEEHFKHDPALRVHIAEDDSSGLKQLLAEDRIDMAFLPHTHPFDSTLCAQQLTVLQNVCCVSKAHRFASRQSIRLEELAQEPLVLFKNSFFQTERILGAFSRLSCTPNVLLYTAQLSTVQNMIASNTAAGFMFAFLLASTPDLIGIPLDPPMTTQVSLVWKKNGHLSSNMKELIRFVQQFPETSFALNGK